MKRLTDNSGFVFKHSFGKTLRGGPTKSNAFVLKRCSDLVICPVHGLESYFHFAAKHGIPLESGYLFRVITESGRVLDNPVSYSSIYDRFRGYLVTLGIFEGETPHSMRAGCAVTLAYAESKTDTRGIMQHVGWSSEITAHYYTRACAIKDASKVADNLAQAADDNTLKNVNSFFNKHAEFDSLHPAFT